MVFEADKVKSTENSVSVCLKMVMVGLLKRLPLQVDAINFAFHRYTLELTLNPLL